jgi:hypothetical protein
MRPLGKERKIFVRKEFHAIYAILCLSKCRSRVQDSAVVVAKHIGGNLKPHEVRTIKVLKALMLFRPLVLTCLCAYERNH